MRLINILIDLKIYIFWRENLGNITAVVWVYYAEFLALLPGMASFISSASPDHTKLCPVPAVKLLGLCWEIDPGPSLFTLLQPEMLTDCAEVSGVISWSYTANLLRWQLEFRENFGPPLLQTHALLWSLSDILGSIFCSYSDSSIFLLVFIQVIHRIGTPFPLLMGPCIATMSTLRSQGRHMWSWESWYISWAIGRWTSNMHTWFLQGLNSLQWNFESPMSLKDSKNFFHLPFFPRYFMRLLYWVDRTS